MRYYNWYYRNTKAQIIIISQQTGENLKVIYKFLETWNPPWLNREQIENLKRPITRKETESVIKSFKQRKI